MQACAGSQASCAAASHAQAVCVPASTHASSIRHEALCKFLLVMGWVQALTMGDSAGVSGSNADAAAPVVRP